MEEGVCTTDGGCQAALDTATEDKSKFMYVIHVLFASVELSEDSLQKILI